MQVIWTPYAIEDLRSIRSYIGSDNPAAAARVAARLKAAADDLEVFPNRGRPGLEPDTRELVVGSHIIAYEVVGDTVWILRIWHGAQDRGQSSANP